jgi:hypothetical protein
MRVLKFDQKEVAALRAAGFDVADDKESASIAGEITIDVIHPHPPEHEFNLEIELPNGSILRCFARRRAILDAGETADEG